MGWTSYNASFYLPNGKVDIKAECDNIYNADMVTWDSSGKAIGKFEVLKSAIIGNTYYAAVKKTKYATENEPEKVMVFAAICLTSVDMQSYYNFAYKDMDESCLPCQCQCPESILDLLTETDIEYAKKWRENCRKYHELRKKYNPSKLPYGTKIRFKWGNEEVTLIKHPPAYQFKTYFWYNEKNHTYFSKKFIPMEYEIVN